MSTFIEQIRDWLDTETRAMLCAEPPQKITAIGIESYSLLLLKHGNDRRRTEDVVTMIRTDNPILLVDYPFVVAQEMTLDEALAGQFALACCDCISAVVRDEVICGASRDYLNSLNKQVKESSEFEMVGVTITQIPHTEEGRRFCWQFLGLAAGMAVPAARQFFRKKARLMQHWAERCGIDFQINEPV
jgi:hypothetical protein